MRKLGRKRVRKPFTDEQLRLMLVRLLTKAPTPLGMSAEWLGQLVGPQMRPDLLPSLENDGLVRRDSTGWWLITDTGKAAAYKGRTTS
jgi:hypothetical protein